MAMALPSRIKTALIGDEPRQIDRVFSRGRREILAAETDLLPENVTRADFDRLAPALQGTEALFSTWGMGEDLACKAAALPNLKAFFYAAGSVKHFAGPLLDKGIVLVSAWAANAVPVSQFASSQILLSLKGYFRNVRDTADPAHRGRVLETDAPGAFGETVAILGCGMVGRAVVDLLRPFGLEILAYDPFLPDEAAAAMGVRKASLDECFARAYVVSNHLPDLSATRKLLAGPLFASLRTGATFINTGRGATVDEAGLASVLRSRPDLTALLDVTDPEPAPADSPWHSLANARLSSHIAGSNGAEVVRMADYCLEEFRAWRAAKPLRWQVTREKLENMA